MVTVIAKDGAVFRGLLVERVPNSHVTLQLATGEFRRIIWAAVAKVSGQGLAGATGPTARVRFRADDERAVLQKFGSAGWFDACKTPCSGSVAQDGVYRVGGKGIRASAPFRLPRQRGQLQVDATVGTRGNGVTGGILAGGGALVAYVGGVLLLVSYANDDAQSTRNDSSAFDEQDRESLRTTGSVMLLGGAVAGVAGLVLLLNNTTDVSVSGGRTGSGPRKTSGRPIQITPRGFVF